MNLAVGSLYMFASTANSGFVELVHRDGLFQVTHHGYRAPTTQCHSYTVACTSMLALPQWWTTKTLCYEAARANFELTVREYGAVDKG